MFYFIAGFLMAGSIGICVGSIMGGNKFQRLYEDEKYYNSLLKSEIKKLKNKAIREN